MYVHERDRFVIIIADDGDPGKIGIGVGIGIGNAMIGAGSDSEPLVCVEARSESTDVCFGGYVERDPGHCGFIAG